jgi:hypothetical protein
MYFRAQDEQVDVYWNESCPEGRAERFLLDGAVKIVCIVKIQEK